jgi:hypothetical protein
MTNSRLSSRLQVAPALPQQLQLQLQNAKGHSASLERGYTIDLSSCFWFACPMQLLPLARARQCLDGHHGIVMDWVHSNLE